MSTVRFDPFMVQLWINKHYHILDSYTWTYLLKQNPITEYISYKYACMYSKCYLFNIIHSIDLIG
jgi:hypothetical protein